MKSPLCFLVEPVGGKLYSSTRENGLVVSTSKEDHTATNRFAVVKSTPIGYSGPIIEGDVVMVHHNTFRKYFDIRGKEVYGPAHFRDTLFLVEDVFLYKRDGEMRCVDPYCLVKPMHIDGKDMMQAAEKERPLLGEMVYSNSELESMGVFDGDMVAFTPDSEYEFLVDGERLYRMFTRNICVSLCQKT
jgi:hypothetical protein